MIEKDKPRPQFDSYATESYDIHPKYAVSRIRVDDEGMAASPKVKNQWEDEILIDDSKIECHGLIFG